MSLELLYLNRLLEIGVFSNNFNEEIIFLMVLHKTNIFPMNKISGFDPLNSKFSLLTKCNKIA